MPTTTRRPTAGKRQAPRKRTRKKRQSFPFRPVILLLIAVVAIGVLVNLLARSPLFNQDRVPSWVDVQLIQVNGSGRRGERLTDVKDIAIHYVGNPGTTAQQNHDFFDQPDTTVSAHFLIGLDGEIIQCIPLSEKSSATNERNLDTISIEVCHPEADGKFTDASYASLVKLTAWLCDHFDLGREHVIRHYDVTGKLCPLYFVEHPEAWEQFLKDVKDF